jgi:hypothetical protein
LQAFAKELIELKPDVLVVGSTPPPSKQGQPSRGRATHHKPDMLAKVDAIVCAARGKNTVNRARSL